MTRPSLRLTGLLVAVLVVGGALGFAGGAVYSSRRPWGWSGHRAVRTAFLDRLQKELDLTPEQRPRVQAVLDRNLDELRRRRAAARLEMQASRDSTQRAIEEILDPAQKERYRKFIARFEARWGRKRGSGDASE